MQRIETKGPGLRVGDKRVIPSIANLAAAFTANGSTEYPRWRYKGGDAGAASLAPWRYGIALPRVAVGTVPTYNNGSPFLESSDIDDSVLFNNSDYYQSAAIPDHPTTEDIVHETIMKWDTSLASYMFYTQGGAGGNRGLVILQVGGLLRCVLHTGVFAVNIESAVIPDAAYVHLMLFCNKDEASTYGSQIYVNGVASGTGVDVSSVGTLAQTYLTIGNTCASNLLYHALWAKASWFQAGAAGPAEWASIAADRFARLTNSKSRDSWHGTTYPTATRNSVGYNSNIVAGATRVHPLGKNLLRSSELLLDDGITWIGFLAEYARTNSMQWSRGFSSWAQTLLSTVAGAVDTPFGSSAHKSLQEDATIAQRFIYANCYDTFLANTPYCLSIYAKSINRDWWWFQPYGNTSARGFTAFINTTTGVCGTLTDLSGIIDDVFSIPLGGGWYRLCIIINNSLAETRYAIYTGPAAADATISYQGTSVVSHYIDQIQMEQGAYPSSPIIVPVTSNITRAEDVFYYDITGMLTDDVRLRSEFVFPSYTIDQKHVYCHLQADATHYIQVYVDTDGLLKASIWDGSEVGTTSVAGSVANGKITYWRMLLKNNYLLLEARQHDESTYTAGTIDTSVTVPQSLTDCYVLMDGTPAYHFSPGHGSDLMVGDKLLTLAGG